MQSKLADGDTFLREMSHGRRLESKTSYWKSDSVNRCSSLWHVVWTMNRYNRLTDDAREVFQVSHWKCIMTCGCPFGVK